MATEKPRITITLEPHVHRTLRMLSAYEGRSMSAIIGDMLVEFEPVLARVVLVLKGAHEAPAQARADMLAAFMKAEEKLEPLMAAATDQFELAVSAAVPVEKAPAKGGGRAAKAPRPAARRKG